MLRIGGLGLSTLAGKDGKTAEESSDMKILIDQKNKAAGKPSAPTS